jgi:hypothetical protein
MAAGLGLREADRGLDQRLRLDAAAARHLVDVDGGEGRRERVVADGLLGDEALVDETARDDGRGHAEQEVASVPGADAQVAGRAARRLRLARVDDHHRCASRPARSP